MQQPAERQSAIATIVGAAEIDHAIARLVLAFGTDPVARRQSVQWQFMAYSKASAT